MIRETFAKKLSISNERKTAIERKDWLKKRDGNLEIIKTRSEKCEEKMLKIMFILWMDYMRLEWNNDHCKCVEFLLCKYILLISPFILPAC